MVNDVRGLFLKINQVDLPYQVFDNLGDVEAMDESQLDVLAPLPVIATQIEEEFEVIDVESEPEPERNYGARKVIASIRQRVFQGFSIPAAEGAKEELVLAPLDEPKVESAPIIETAPITAEVEAPAAPTVAPAIPAAAPVPLFPAKPAAPTGGGLLRRYAPTPAPAPAPAATRAPNGETQLKTLFGRLADLV
ncbi:MAG: hypothetical protein ABW063_03645 [Caulobacter sp.]